MKALVVLMLFLGGAFALFWYTSLPDRVFTSAEGGITFSYPAQMFVKNSSGTMDQFSVALAESNDVPDTQNAPFIEVSVTNRVSNVPLEKWLLMRGDKYLIKSVIPPIDIQTSEFDGISFDWTNGSENGKTVVLDAGERVVMVVAQKTTPSALKALNTILSTFAFINHDSLNR